MNVENVTGISVAKDKRYFHRLECWLLWTTVFSVAPGPLVFYRVKRDVTVRRAGDWPLLSWLAVVVVATGIAGLRNRLPGVEATPLIVDLAADEPNPFYRRFCYTFAWAALLHSTLMNLTELVVGTLTGRGPAREVYEYGYFPLAGVIFVLGLRGVLPRAKASTRGEGVERRVFSGAAWAGGISQLALGFLSALLTRKRQTYALKLLIFVPMLSTLALCAKLGLLPRTQAVPSKPKDASMRMEADIVPVGVKI
jgi:hypothetical protein